MNDLRISTNSSHSALLSSITNANSTSFFCVLRVLPLLFLLLIFYFPSTTSFTALPSMLTHSSCFGVEISLSHFNFENFAKLTNQVACNSDEQLQ